MTSEAKEPKPCPFCGWAGEHDIDVDEAGASVECRKCCCTGPLGSDRAEAIMVWNRRPTVDTAVQAERERCALIAGRIDDEGTEPHKVGSDLAWLDAFTPDPPTPGGSDDE